MEERTLEVTIISAEALKKVSTFAHENCYAVAYILPTEKKTTAVDKFGGVNPNWNTKLILKCDDKLLQRDGWYITVEIYHYGSFGSKLVGKSKISLLEVGKRAGGKQPQLMAIEVRRPSGRVKGVLNVSIKVGEKTTVRHRNQSGQGLSANSGQGGQPLGYPQTYPPSSWSAQEPAVYPPPMNGYNPAVYPPPKAGSDSSLANAQAVYPPPKASSVSSATGSSGSKQEEPVLAYPATGYPAGYPPQQYGQQAGPQYYGSQYAGPQQYYQGNATYQNVQNSRPSRWQGSSSSGGGGLGLIGGVLGGLLLGEVIGDIF